MIFLGTVFCSDGKSLLPPTNKQDTVIAIQIFDGIYNHLYVSTDTNITHNDLNNEWDENTILNAKFNGDFEAGNTAFSLENTKYIVVKRREVDTMNWTTIYVKEVKTREDLNVNIIDKYARSGVEYQYCVSSYSEDRIENSFMIENVYSEFEGCYITDKDCLYGTIYNVDGCDTTRNVANQVVEMLNSKYMKVVSNSEVNCESGSVTGAFFKVDEETGEIDRQEGLNYRNSVKDRLANKKPLILKVSDGRIWMIRPSGTISDSMDGHRDLRNISFEWTEIGDINDMETLYMNGFSDVDSRWW